MRIVIVDDHILFREGLAAIIQRECDVEVVGLVGTASEAVETVLSLRPDITLMDFSLPDGTGVEATRKIIAASPDSKIVFMTMSERDEDLIAAIRAGAVGYLLKNMSPAKLANALRSVLGGEGALSRSMTLRVMKELSRTRESEPAEAPALAKLTPREKELLAKLAAGMSNPEIARDLVISENTVKYHVHSILEKLNLRDRTEAARFAREHGIR
jgi:DNA-binding NarL/FixJ family response regulator